MLEVRADLPTREEDDLGRQTGRVVEVYCTGLTCSVLMDLIAFQRPCSGIPAKTMWGGGTMGYDTLQIKILNY